MASRLQTWRSCGQPLSAAVVDGSTLKDSLLSHPTCEQVVMVCVCWHLPNSSGIPESSKHQTQLRGRLDDYTAARLMQQDLHRASKNVPDLQSTPATSSSALFTDSAHPSIFMHM